MRTIGEEVEITYSQEDAYGCKSDLTFNMKPDMIIDLTNYRLIDRILMLPRLLLFGECDLKWKK